MVTKSKKEGAGKKRKVKVLNLNKETIRDLTGSDARRVKGGVQGRAYSLSTVKSDALLSALCGGQTAVTCGGESLGKSGTLGQSGAD